MNRATYTDEMYFADGEVREDTTVILEDVDTGEPTGVIGLCTRVLLTGDYPPEGPDADLRDLGWT